MTIIDRSPIKKNGFSILVVDDDPEVGRFMFSCVEGLGHQVEWSGHPYEALELFSKKNHDIVITDLKMPEMDGLTLLKRIKAMNDDTEILVITGYGSVENALDCINAGA
ncbi:MAG: response regulator, partial [Pseudomonadota bacterium]